MRQEEDVFGELERESKSIDPHPNILMGGLKNTVETPFRYD
jgi:hypothetical protein